MPITLVFYTDWVKKEERKDDETLANSTKQSTQQTKGGKERKGSKSRKKTQQHSQSV
jgi:hypothetical protein